MLSAGTAVALLLAVPPITERPGELSAPYCTVPSQHLAQHDDPSTEFWRCRPPQCSGDQVPCDLRIGPNGCMQWRCCGRR